MKSKILVQIRKELYVLSNNSVVLFGSHVEGGIREISGYDIAVLTKIIDENLLSDLKIKLASEITPPYEIHVFEALPIHVQISIINNYKVIFGNPLDISEYFYEYRKKWDDCKYRILSNLITNSEERERLRILGDKVIAKYSQKNLTT